jgi:hypothetical protein
MKQKALCAGTATAWLLVLGAMPAHAFETILTACARTNGSAFYNVTPDGAAARECREDDQQVRLIEVVDTSSYRKFRGTADDGTRMLGKVGGIEVWLWNDGGTDQGACNLEITAEPGGEPEFIINLLTNVEGSGGENVDQREELNAELDFEPALLQVPDGKAMFKAGPVAYLLPDGAMYTFTDIFLNYSGVGHPWCFGAVTVKRDDVTRGFAK